MRLSPETSRPKGIWPIATHLYLCGGLFHTRQLEHQFESMRYVVYSAVAPFDVSLKVLGEFVVVLELVGPGIGIGRGMLGIGIGLGIGLGLGLRLGIDIGLGLHHLAEELGVALATQEGVDTHNALEEGAVDRCGVAWRVARGARDLVNLQRRCRQRVEVTGHEVTGLVRPWGNEQHE